MGYMSKEIAEPYSLLLFAENAKISHCMRSSSRGGRGSVLALHRQPQGELRDEHLGQVAAEHTDRLLPRMAERSLFKILRDERVVVAVGEGRDTPRLTFDGL